MIFNSIDFGIFLPLVFCCYWFLFQRSLSAQNLFIVIVSYVFYGWWDYRFLSLLFFSSLVDYMVGVGLSRTEAPSRRKLLLIISLTINLGLLGFFKYFNFFIDSFTEAFTFFGYTISETSLEIVLPVGIRFFFF